MTSRPQTPTMIMRGQSAYDTHVMKMPLEEKAVAGITDFLRAHDDELVALMALCGVDWHTVALPSWERFVTPADLQRAVVHPSDEERERQRQQWEAFENARVIPRQEVEGEFVHERTDPSEERVGGNGL